MSSVNTRAPILGLATKVVRTRLAEPVRTAIHDSAEIDHVLVRLHAQGAVTGIGHLFAFGEGWALALEAMVRQLGEALVGADAADPEAVHARMLGAIRFMGLKGAAQMAVAALDTACWDVTGKLRREPLWSLLGGTRRPLPCYASDSLWLGDPVEELSEKARRRLELGFGAMKVRVGSQDAAADERRVAEVRRAVGPDVTLMADANQGWTREHAIETGRRLRQHGLYWLEEPVPAEDHASLRPVAEATGIPIATGETWFGMLETQEGLDAGGVSVLMPDLERIGGVTGWLRAAAAARAAGAKVSPHLFPEVCVHLMCAQPDDHLLEWVPWYEDLFEGAPAVREGRLEPGDGPGLGFDFNPRVFPG
jgi:L-alanine-DL-glutamate epimerase-like enolase superfamily enzyme